MREYLEQDERKLDAVGLIMKRGIPLEVEVWIEENGLATGLDKKGRPVISMPSKLLIKLLDRIEKEKIPI